MSKKEESPQSEWLKVKDKTKLKTIYGGTEKDILLITLIGRRFGLLNKNTSQLLKEDLWKEIQNIFNGQFGTNRSIEQLKNKWNRLVTISKKEMYNLIRKKINAVSFMDGNCVRPSMRSFHVWKIIEPFLNREHECQDYEKEYNDFMNNSEYIEDIQFHVNDFADFASNIFKLITSDFV